MIVIGTPVWNSRLTPAIRTYLRDNDLSGKKVAIFSTNEGRGNEKTLAMIRSLIPRGNIVGELGVSKALEKQAETESKISAWCSNLKSI